MGHGAIGDKQVGPIGDGWEKERVYQAAGLEGREP